MIGTAIGIIVAVIAVWYARRQTALAQQQTALAQEQAAIAKRLSDEQEERNREENEWQAKQEQLANLLIRIGPTTSHQIPGGFAGNAYRNAYQSIYSDPNLRSRIETYVIELANNRTSFQVRKPEPHVLRSPTFRKTVEEATAIMDKYKADEPESYRSTFGVRD